MSEKYTRMEHRNVSGLISDVLKAVGNKPAFIELHNLVEILDINLTDKYFREAFNYKPTDGIATLIQYDAIHLYDFSKLLDKADRKTENSSEIPNNCEHITEDGVTCAKYPACDDCLDNPLNKLKGSERLVKGSEQTDCQTCKWWSSCGYCVHRECKGYAPQTERSSE